MADEERRFREDFLKLEDASHKYDADELDAKGFKAVSTSFGGYLQRGDLQMLRIRVPGGRLSVEHASWSVAATTGWNN